MGNPETKGRPKTEKSLNLGGFSCEYPLANDFFLGGMWLQEEPDKRETAHIPDPEKANNCIPKAEKTTAHETATPRIRSTQPVGHLGENKDIPNDNPDN